MKCKCGSKRFTVSAIEYHTWLVDENGQFVEDRDCGDATSDLTEAECDKCGEMCKALYGFQMTVNKVANSTNEHVKKLVAKVDKLYGKHDFVICWPCTVEMMGIPTLAQKRMAEARKAKNAEQTKEQKGAETPSETEKA